MKICDRCKKVERYSIVQTFTFGLHAEKAPVKGQYLSFELDLCTKCKDELACGYDILNCWKKNH